MNPYEDALTDHQKRRVEQGRDVLLKRWNAPPFSAIEFSNTTFHTRELISKEDALIPHDVFRVNNTPAAFPAVWENEKRRCSEFVFEHHFGHIDILVPQEYYLRQQKCFMSMDVACIGNVMLYLMAIVICLYVASALNDIA